MRPLRNYIHVAPDELADHVSSAGIIIRARTGLQKSEEQLGRTGTVLAVGPGKRNKHGELLPLDVQPGDRILFGEFEYPKCEMGIVLQEEDIEGVIESNT